MSDKVTVTAKPVYDLADDKDSEDICHKDAYDTYDTDRNFFIELIGGEKPEQGQKCKGFYNAGTFEVDI